MKNVTLISIALCLFIFCGCEMPSYHYTLVTTGTTYTNDAKDEDPLYRQGALPTVLIMGDSRAIGGGTFSLIPNRLFNLGVGGSTTRGVLNKLYRVPSIRPRYVFIFTGMNDWGRVPLEEFKSNIQDISNYFKSAHVQCVFMEWGLNPAVEERYKPEIKPYGDAYISAPGITYLPIGNLY